MRKLVSLLMLAFIITFPIHADVSIPLDLDCCISINEKLDQQTDILKRQYELGVKCEQNVNNIQDLLVQIPEKRKQSDKWGNLFGSLLGTVMSACVAIGVFVYGLRNEKIKERAKRKSLLKSFSLILNSIIKICEKKNKAIERYADAVKMRPWSHNKLGIIPIDEILRVKNMDIAQTADAFFEFHIKEKYYIDLYSKLDFIYDLFKSMENDYFKHSHDYVTNPSNEIIEIIRWSQEFIIKELRCGKFEKITFHIMTQYNKFQEGIDSNKENMCNINYINTNFTIPYLELFSSDLVNEEPLELLSKLKRARDLYTFVCNGNEDFSRELLSSQENINKCIDTFSNIVKEINTKIDYKPEPNINPLQISEE